MNETQEQYYIPDMRCECCGDSNLFTVNFDKYLLLVVSTYTDIKYLDDDNDETFVSGWKPIDSISPDYIKSLTNEAIDGILLYTKDGTFPMIPKDEEEKNLYKKKDNVIDLFDYFKNEKS